MRLEALGLTSVKTKGDGNCFFRAVAQMVLLDNNLHDFVRHQAIQQILNSPEAYRPFISGQNNSINQYVEFMSRPGSWADNAIIRATADVLQVEIRLISTNDYVPIFTPENGNPSSVINLAYIQDVHYMSTRVTRSKNENGNKNESKTENML